MKAKSPRGAKTRNRILQAAAELIQKTGVHGTSVDDVLKASGTGKSQFYHYFGSKTLMIRELIGYQLERLPAVKPDRLFALDTLAGVEEWFESILTDFQGGAYREGCPIGNLASELSSNNEELRERLRESFGSWEEALAAGLRAMKRKGELRPDADPEGLATFVIAALEGALLLAKTERSTRPLEKTFEHVLKLLKLQRYVGGTAGPRRGRSSPLKLGFCP